MSGQKILLLFLFSMFLVSCESDLNDNSAYDELYYGGSTPAARSFTPAQRRAIAIAIPYFVENGLDTSGCSYEVTEDSVNYQVEFVKKWDRHVLPETGDVYYTFDGGTVTIRKRDFTFVSYGTVFGIT